MSDDNTDRLEAARHFYKTGEWSNCRDIYEDIINRLVDRLGEALERIGVLQLTGSNIAKERDQLRSRLETYRSAAIERDNGYDRCRFCRHQTHMGQEIHHDDYCPLVVERRELKCRGGCGRVAMLTTQTESWGCQECHERGAA